MRFRVETPRREDRRRDLEGEEDTELYVNRLVEDLLPQAITRKILRKATAKDRQMKMLVEDIKIGKCR